MIRKIVGYFLENRLVAFLLLFVFILWGMIVTPFGHVLDFLPEDPVAVDAIPDIGENQQIVSTRWDGRSPQDVEDQITYPLTTALLGIPGVKSIRSASLFGLSSIYIIFDEKVDFYWSRSRILEKLNALPEGLLPKGARAALGPDATALGQVYWYTLEGKDSKGNPVGGWDLNQIRTIQDFYVKPALTSVSGVSEVASIGGFVQEYQVDIDPEALKIHRIPLQKIAKAIQNANRDAGAQTMEINRVEYFVRGLGYVRSVKDLEESVVDVQDNVPIRIKDVARVILGPAARRGLLDKEGLEAVGGVVVARHGANPLEVIRQVKAKIKEITPGLPVKKLINGVESRLTITPFYDRSKLIDETLDTLLEALSLEALITILVIVVMLAHLEASLIVSMLLPVSILMVFIAMRYFGVEANIVALSGIAIAIGAMVDLGVILTENIIREVKSAPPGQKLRRTIYQAAAEVSPAIITAVATTVVSFLPVFMLEAAEGKLFKPLAFTKTFALIAALIVTLFILPSLTYELLNIKKRKVFASNAWRISLLIGGLLVVLFVNAWAGFSLMALGAAGFVIQYSSGQHFIVKNLSLIIVVASVAWLLSKIWTPLGADRSHLLNFVFTTAFIGLLLGMFRLLERFYGTMLGWCLANKSKFLFIPFLLIFCGGMIWLGFDRVFGWAANGFDRLGWTVRKTAAWSKLSGAFPGVGKEFMPSLDEGDFLLMPTSMPHAGIEQNKQTLQQLDQSVAAIPEVELVVGKAGRVESALDPAPLSMYENLIRYKPEYATDESGRKLRFKTDEKGRFLLTSGKALKREEILKRRLPLADLAPDASGRYFRNWRESIRSPQDIWNEIAAVTQMPGVTSAPKLQPIEARLVMLQTGMRSPMGIKVFGPDLKSIESFSAKLEALLKQAPSIKSETVFAERIVGKPYLHLNIDREAIARYGLQIEDVQQIIETAIGGMPLTYAVEGRERFVIRARYPRELRDDPETLKKIYVPTPTGQVPLSMLVRIEYEHGPQMIKSENTFLVGYVLFDKKEGHAEVDVVEAAQDLIKERIDSGALSAPPGVRHQFSGTYENQLRAQGRLMWVIPLVLIIVFLILYFQFRSVSTSLMIFSGIALAFSGGFWMLWFYGQEWFMNFSVFGTSLRELFQVRQTHLSIAVWIGFIALFGIATDDGVLMSSYLDQIFRAKRPDNLMAVREAVVEGASRRIKPALMTTATTLIALLPVLSATGRGADVMIPMAIPTFGGMLMATIGCFLTPVLYAFREERKLIKKSRT